MNREPNQERELPQLLAELLDGQLSPEQKVQLADLLRDDPDAQQIYLDYCLTHALLRRELGGLNHLPETPIGSRDISLASQQMPVGPISVVDDPSLAPLPSATRWPFVGHFPVGDALVSYMAAAVIMAAGILAAWAWKISDRPDIAGQAPHSTNTSFAAAQSAQQYVARITGTVDCRWERKQGLGIRVWGLEGREGRGKVQGSSSKVQGKKIDRFPNSNPQSLIHNPSLTTTHYPLTTPHKSLVSLGDRFILSAGLMEITYNTGARVILQGPCTFEVDSAAGGFLTVGKLTARVESGSSKRETGGEGRSKVQGSRFKAGKSPNHQISKSPNCPLTTNHYPLFTIKTPTATVTDLGTEFSVEVEKDQSTQVQVIEGQVQFLSCKGDGMSVVLAAGNAARVSPNEAKIESAVLRPDAFIRSLASQPRNAAGNPTEKAYIESVLADNPLGYWPLNEPELSRIFSDRSGNAFHGSAMYKVEAAQPGPFGDGSRAIGLDGSGYIDLGRHDQFAMKNDFTVEAWIWTEKPLLHSTIFSAVGSDLDGQLGWCLSAYSCEPNKAGTIGVRFTAFHSQPEYPQDTSFALPEGSVPQCRWTHVAVVYDRHQMVYFYQDGKCVESKHRDVAVRVGPTWLAIGNVDWNNQCYWRGRLAHVTVYPQALGAERIKEHYLQQTKNIVKNGK